MKIQKLSNNLCFKGSIIDCHVHIGNWYNQKYLIENLDVFTKEPLSNGDTVEKMLVSNLNSIIKEGRLSEQAGLEEILSLTKNNPKYAVIAVCQPNLTNGNTDTIAKMVKQYRDRIFGLKFHPNSLKCSAKDACYDNYLKFAQVNRLPCIFHTDSNGFSNVEDIYQLAKKIPDTPVILGHCGGYDDFPKAVKVLKQSIVNNDAKLYCDISWLDWKDGLPDGVHSRVKQLIKELKEVNGLERIMFGTDVPLGCFGENPVGNISPKEAYTKMISGIKTMIKNNFGDEAEEITHKIFYQNANDLFFESVQPSQPTQPIKKSLLNFLKSKTGIITTLGITTALVAGFLIQKHFCKQNSSSLLKQKGLS